MRRDGVHEGCALGALAQRLVAVDSSAPSSPPPRCCGATTAGANFQRVVVTGGPS
ncbi:MAG: hypothetical protein U1E57_08095 [Paenacidovorax caeni]